MPSAQNITIEDPSGATDNEIEGIMSNNDFMTFEQLVSDLQAENRRQRSLKVAPVPVGEIVGHCGEVTFGNFLTEKRRDDLVPPSPPVIGHVGVGARITLLSRRTPDSPGSYHFSTAIVLGTDGESVDGYIFQSSVHPNRRIKVDQTQIIDCLPALDLDETEVRSVIYEHIPF